MDPVFDTRATSDVLIAVAKADASTAGRYPSADFRTWMMGQVGGASALGKALPRGLANGSLPIAARTRTASATRMSAPSNQTGDFHFVVYPSPVLGDGSGANKPWLQELPDPVSKIVWQTWIEIHPLTARRLGVEPGDHLEVSTGTGTVVAPAYLYLAFARTRSRCPSARDTHRTAAMRRTSA
jgi:hypothetical protein